MKNNNSIQREARISVLISACSLLIATFLNAQTTVQRYVDSDATHHYDVKVPAGFAYMYLLAKGADGGSITDPNVTGMWGGEGVRVSGFVPIGNGQGQIPVGSSLRLIPGQAGASGQYKGGGGGGSAIAFRSPDANANWVLLMVAGGGGGSGCDAYHKPGKAGTTHENGLDGENTSGKLQGNGGSNGNGGTRNSVQGYPGGGMFTDGEGDCAGKAGSLGYEPAGGAGGGISCGSTTVRGGFGFGGGGSGTRTKDDDYAGAGGGGGGYSGGGGGNADDNDADGGPGGGGGSYINTSYIQLVSAKSFTISPSNDGYVSYEFLNIPSIQLAKEKTKCMDPGGTSNGANVLLNTCEANTTQTWFIYGSSFRLAASTNKCLDLPSSNTTDGTHIQLWDCNGTDAQNWIYDVANQDIHSKIKFNKCLDLKSGNTADQTAIQLFQCNGTGAQKWLLDGVPTKLPSGTNNQIKLIMAPGKCVEAKNGHTGQGTKIQLNTCASSNAQYFLFDGRHIQMQVAPDKCISPNPNQLSSSAPGVILLNCDNGNLTEWIYDGFTKSFRSGFDMNKCLDLDHSQVANGTIFQLWDCNGSGAQQFELN